MEGLTILENTQDTRAVRLGLHAFAQLIPTFDHAQREGASLRFTHEEETIATGYFSYIRLDESGRINPPVRVCVADYSPESEDWEEVVWGFLRTSYNRIGLVDVSTFMAGLYAADMAAEEMLYGTVVPWSAKDDVFLASRFLIYESLELPPELEHKNNSASHVGIDVQQRSGLSTDSRLLHLHTDANVGALLQFSSGGHIQTAKGNVQLAEDQALFLRGQMYGEWMRAVTGDASLSELGPEAHGIEISSDEASFYGPVEYRAGTTRLLLAPSRNRQVGYRGSALTFLEPSSSLHLSAGYDDASGTAVIFNHENPYLGAESVAKLMAA